jgi:hypothetical protein
MNATSSFAPRMDNALHDSTKARIYFSNGLVNYYATNAEAYALWLALPKGTRAAMRPANDSTPVYTWDCVDKL